MNTKITLADAVKICREIEPKLRGIGYHCGLTGSTLYAGESSKDVDIIIYPHDIKKQIPLTTVIKIIGATTEMYHSQGDFIADKIVPSTTDKLVVVADYLGTRVDLFFLT